MSTKRSAVPPQNSRNHGSQLRQQQLQAWKLHHQQSALDSFRRLRKTPIQSLLTACVIAIALMLPAALWVALNNIEQLGEGWDASPKISVYLKPQMDMVAIDALKNQLMARPGVKQVVYISPDEALNKLKTMAGFGETLQGLAHNPLPPTLIVTPVFNAVDIEQIQAITNDIAKEPIVDQVDMDMAWVRRLQQWLALGKQCAYGLAGLLSFGVLIVVGNTIRLAIENRRDEILIIKLVGGTNGFIRRPFLYTGAWYGLLGGLVASVALAICFMLLRNATRDLAAAYQTDFILSGLGFAGTVILVTCSAIIGLLGAILAVGRHLQEIEPR